MPQDTIRAALGAVLQDLGGDSGKVDVEGMPGQGDDEAGADEPSTENPEA